MKCNAINADDLHFGFCENCGYELNSEDINEYQKCPNCEYEILNVYEKEGDE